jgi:PHD/YefM family antitoxin component YafN of YafNO toxin-antitoxin module
MIQQDDRDSIWQMADAAFQRVVTKVVQRARETGTPIVVWRDGRVVWIPVEEWEAEERRKRESSQG